MEDINKTIHSELKEYAQLYFAAIITANTVDGKCRLKPGKYTAREFQVNSPRNAMGAAYRLPDDEFFGETVTIKCGTFELRFPYAQVFAMLARWEAMMKPGKDKAVFEIGAIEEKTAKVIVDGKTALGSYKTKGMRLQRVHGNWWMPRKLPKCGNVALCYSLNGAVFIPGLQFSTEQLLNNPEKVVERCAKFDDAKIIELLISYITNETNSPAHGYFVEVARLAGVDTNSDDAVKIAETAREKKRQRDEEIALQETEERERHRIREEEARKQIEEEERQAAESLAKAKRNFISGKMISGNDFERIADAVGYAINIRTVGTLRKRVTWIKVGAEGTPTVYGTKRRAGLEGVFNAIREAYARLKNSMPERVRHISEIMETCRVHDENTGEETDEYKYYKWLTSAHNGTYHTIADNALAEALTGIFLAAYRKGEGHIIAMNKDGMLMESVITSIKPPQSPETPQITECTGEQPEPRETARKRQNRAIDCKRTTRRDTLRPVTYVSRECSTANAPPGLFARTGSDLLADHTEFQNISVN